MPGFVSDPMLFSILILALLAPMHMKIVNEITVFIVARNHYHNGHKTAKVRVTILS